MHAKIVLTDINSSGTQIQSKPAMHRKLAKRFLSAIFIAVFNQVNVSPVYHIQGW